jgi:hypothetical protein
MNASRFASHARVLWRTERIVAELRLKRLLGNLGLQALAALATSCALLLFELAAYFALVQSWSAIASATMLGFVNLVVAGLLVLFALRRPAGRELTLANDVHREALAAFEAELQHAETTAPATLRAALESAAIPLLLPLIPLVIRRLRRARAATPATDDL